MHEHAKLYILHKHHVSIKAAKAKFHPRILHFTSRITFLQHRVKRERKTVQKCTTIFALPNFV